MSIQIKFDDADVQRVIDSLRDKSKSEESVFKKSINDTANKAKKLMIEGINKRYAGYAPESVESRTAIRKASVAHLGAEIIFKSREHRYLSFRVNDVATQISRPRWSNGRRIDHVMLQGTQLRNAPMKNLTGYGGRPAFVINGKHGYTLVVKRVTPWWTSRWRQKKWNSKELKTYMGSSDMTMARMVYEEEGMADRISAMLHENCMAALDAALKKG